MVVNHAEVCLPPTVSKKAVSSTFSLLTSDTLLLKHWELQCPFLLHRWQLAPFAGSFLWGCGSFLLWMHAFVVGVALDLLELVWLSRLVIHSAEALNSFCCSPTVSFHWILILAFSMVCSASSYSCCERATPWIPTTSRESSHPRAPHSHSSRLVPWCMLQQSHFWVPSVESCTFVYYISMHLEEPVKSVEYWLVDFALGFCGICWGQYAFRLFTNAIEKSVDLLHRSLPASPEATWNCLKHFFHLSHAVFEGSKIQRRWRFQSQLGHRLPLLIHLWVNTHQTDSTQ